MRRDATRASRRIHPPPTPTGRTRVCVDTPHPSSYSQRLVYHVSSVSRATSPPVRGRTFSSAPRRATPRSARVHLVNTRSTPVQQKQLSLTNNRSARANGSSSLRENRGRPRGGKMAHLCSASFHSLVFSPTGKFLPAASRIFCASRLRIHMIFHPRCKHIYDRITARTRRRKKARSSAFEYHWRTLDYVS